MFKLIRFLPLVFICLSPTILFAAGDNEVVATVNGKKISKTDFNRRYKENVQVFRFTPPTKMGVLHDIINFELAVQEAKKMGLEKNPEVQERIGAILYQSLIENKLSEKFKGSSDSI